MVKILLTLSVVKDWWKYSWSCLCGKSEGRFVCLIFMKRLLKVLLALFVWRDEWNCSCPYLSGETGENHFDPIFVERPHQVLLVSLVLRDRRNSCWLWLWEETGESRICHICLERLLMIFWPYTSGKALKVLLSIFFWEGWWKSWWPYVWKEKWNSCVPYLTKETKESLPGHICLERLAKILPSRLVKVLVKVFLSFSVFRRGWRYCWP